ncbi:TPA: hypothetical protein QCK11_004930 [Enterobacter asburiae]|nr:hypothetical protein [Enterobacter asburiae]
MENKNNVAQEELTHTVAQDVERKIVLCYRCLSCYDLNNAPLKKVDGFEKQRTGMPLLWL